MNYCYILIEGPDCSGKDTQALHLVRRLTDMGLNPLLVREPCDDLPTGKLLRQLLRSGEYPEAHAGLFMADRMALQTRIIKPAIEARRPVVSIRSYLSTLAYQQENWPLDWLFDLHRMLPIKPSHVVLLDVDAEEGMRRRTGRELDGGAPAEVYEKLDIQKRVRARYLDLMGVLPDHLPEANLAVVPTTGRPEALIAETVWNFIHGQPDTVCPHLGSYEAGCPHLTALFECKKFLPASQCPGIHPSPETTL